MVGWTRRNKRKEEKKPSVAQVCKAGGCTCYCHKPVPDEDVKKGMWLSGMLLFIILAPFVGMPLLISHWAEESQKDSPPPPYYCAGLTSTGAPADCHPAILSPDVQKLYEDQWREDHK
jgi:hypothetical protein